ncbi:glycoside hydrolase family 3 N-terminal domain-containing protein [candidate division KSB1 bacterium]
MPDYKNSKLPVEKRVKNLLDRMTIEEKAGQLQCMLKEVKEGDEILRNSIGGLGCFLRPYRAKEAAAAANRVQKLFMENTRLGIPVIIHDEALHGLVGTGATSFPQAIGLASTWNTALMSKVASAIAKETKARGIRQVLSPVVNIARDVRWGRVEETYGEDPCITAKMGTAFCRAFEEMDIITTPKHFVANIGDGGRDSNPVHFSERLLREIYFPGFKACIQEGGATSLMPAYNSHDGIPCSSNRWLLTEIIRNEWGFEGFTVADYGSVGGIFTAHKTAVTEEETAKQAVEAGMDVELPNIYIYGEPLLRALKKGDLSEEVLNKAVSRILKAKFKIGLFENPYTDPNESEKINDCTGHRKLALQAARESLVLLRNEDNFLPLSKNIKSVTVIGPDAEYVRLGGYSGYGMKKVSILEGIKNIISNKTKVRYEKGFDLPGGILPAVKEKNLIPFGGKTGEKGLKGEYFNNKNLTGQPVLVRTDRSIHFNWSSKPPDPIIDQTPFSVRWTGYLVPDTTAEYKIGISSDDGVRMYIDGKLIIDKWFDRGVTPEVINIDFEAGRKYELKIEYFQKGGYTFVSLGWDKTNIETGNLTKAVDAAEKADAVIVVAGVVEGEGRDRANLDLLPDQENLIRKVANTGTPTAVVIIGGSAVTMKSG